jgi:hypothetical protein
VLTALSALAAELPEVAEVDLNPVIVSGAGPRIADALVVRSPEGPDRVSTDRDAVRREAKNSST